MSAAPPVTVRNDFAANVRRDTFPLLIAAAEGTLAVHQLPDDSKDGVTRNVLEISGEGLAPVRLYIDAAAPRIRAPDIRNTRT